MPKDFKKMVSRPSLFGAWHLGEVVENKSLNSPVLFLGKALNERPSFVWKIDGPVFPPKKGLVTSRASDSKKKMPYNTECKLSAVATPNREKLKERRKVISLLISILQ